MRRKLPSIAALQALVAVARNKSFTRAATELGVTQAAITQHVKNLEEMLGVQLLLRSSGSVSPTEAGGSYLDTIQPSLFDISTATSRLIERESGDVVTIDCRGAFAVTRLLPALEEFRILHSDVSFHIRTMVQPQGKARPECDLGVWHGLGNWPTVRSWKLFDEEIFPVCSPLVLQSSPLHSASDLRHHTIIRANSDTLRDDWPIWLAVAGVGDLPTPEELHCNYLLFAIHAAIEGLGIAIGRTGIVEHELQSGRLVEPFGLRMPTPTAYHLVEPLGQQESSKVKLMREWMLDRLRKPG